MLKKFILFLIFISSAQAVWAAETYSAAVNVDTENRIVTGTLAVSADTKSKISVNLDGFYDIYIDNAPLRIKAAAIDLSLESGTVKTIYFKKNLKESDIISGDFISVYRVVPAVSGGENVGYVFSVTLPKGFEAVSSGETVKKIEKRMKDEFIFTMTKPAGSFDLIASTDYAVKTAKAGDVEIAAYFFNENKDLAEKYLKRTAEYIKTYERLLQSEFPYKRFSIAEHKVPYGYAAPTYTVMGSSVIRLPFIAYTSLGHEILHQWFGAAIGLSEGGNWFEALTSYLSDICGLLTEAEREEYRKNIIVSYENYSENGRDYPLKDFRSNDSKLSQSIGYGKGAMLFSMIRAEIGSEAFKEGLRRFVKEYKYKDASWRNIFNFFEGAVPEDFFDYWLNESGIPEIAVSGGIFSVEKGELSIKFAIERSIGPEKITVPYTVFYKNGRYDGAVSSAKGRTEVSVPVESTEARLVLDGGYNIMRRLSAAERPASLSGILASENAIGVASGENSCGGLFDALGVKEIKDGKNVSLADISGGDIIVCGFDDPVLKLLAAGLKPDLRASSEYAVFKNPLAEGRYIMAARAPAPENIRLLEHYGNYAVLKFSGGKNIEKASDTSASNGMEVLSGANDTAVETGSIRSIDDTVKVAGLYPAVFIGERHDSYAHHLNQLEIIKRLNDSGVRLAVGFEMVPKLFQSVLSDFVDGKISEAEFVEGIEYYDRWGFDYNLYAPLFRYLRENKIPAAALNIDGGIIRKISSGKAGELTEEELAAIPKEMRLFNRGYENEMREIFDMHPPKAGAERSFSDFYLAQNIWDEAMAESAVRFQEADPSRVIVIIAGSGHVDKKSGIPLRYERLTGKKPFVITQDEVPDKTRSDVVLSSGAVYSEGTPKLGIVLNTDGGDMMKIKSVDKGSPAAEAGIKAGDVLLSCGGRTIGGKIGVLRYALFEAGYGSDIKCSVKRGNKTLDLTAALKRYTEDEKDTKAGGR